MKELWKRMAGELGDPRRSRERWLEIDGGTMMILICEKNKKVKTLELALKATKLVLRGSSSRCLD